ncbi:hypothetical protein ASE00_02985 [Sphingomonas sp. Root710]|uniref:bifunctional lysylphosphatidylglycerol flippase/synthetase MprF n=1 Tax=Sphingomonas sp. Root710 TaxID=1736594 RepID=UPI0006F9243F|nr:bifunctional lysylphosphatidylglycerol flippase/synthetase MprF [Sphingomonas sp. Root710]KRB85753.1 hypothetical protein ASE00_02985 [Sphingomonas sp. Root710]
MTALNHARWTEVFRRHRAKANVVAVLLITTFGFGALHRLTEEVALSDVRRAFHALPATHVAGAIALTVMSYLALTLYDVVALRVIGRRLPWRTAAYASFASYTLSHNLGLSLLTGGSARFHIYSRAGLDSTDVARVIAIASIAFWTGVFTVAAITMLMGWGTLDMAGYAVPRALQILAGGAFVGVIALSLAALMRWRSASLFGWRVALPSPGQGVAIIAVSAVDLSVASAALFILLPGATFAAWPDFFLGYAMAIIIALISHVPGGIGVFEAVIIATTPGDPTDIAAALIAYRLIYYILPLIGAAALMAWVEGKRWQARIGQALSDARLIADGIVPLLASTIIFLAGAVLLVSGSLPAVPGRMRDLHDIIALPLIEMAHVFASMTGTALLLMTPGLYRRLDGAFYATRLLLLAGAILSLLKGLDYEEATAMLAAAGLLQFSRCAFYRKTALIAAPFTPKWIAAVLSVLLLSLWIGFFAFKHVAYRDDLWLEFALRGDASRFLRATVAAGALLIFWSIWRLFAPAPITHAVQALPPETAERAIAESNRTDAMLAFTGDKRFLVSPGNDAFLMYQIKGASWIVMGDPIGPTESWADLFWEMRTLVDAAQGRLLFYQISEKSLPMMIEMGLQIVKFGESASVDLEGFTLEGPERRPLRHAVRRAEREGLSFTIVPAAQVPAIFDQLAEISDEWMRSKGAAEKGFSIGRFGRDYMTRFDCALVSHHGRAVAFANIWATPNHAELSVDLMRHRAEMPYGVMDFLFVELMVWGKANGYRSFSLGMAPLSGIEARQLSPAWSKAAALVVRYGNSFYGFDGLRAYKSKFTPTWSPRYVASQGGLGFLMALGDVKALIGND